MCLAMLSERRNPMCDRPSPRALILEHRMAIAQIDRLLSRRRGNTGTPHVDADISQKGEITLMRWQAMIAVVTILDQQFPVGAGTICLLTGDDLHAYFGLIGY